MKVKCPQNTIFISRKKYFGNLTGRNRYSYVCMHCLQQHKCLKNTNGIHNTLLQLRGNALNIILLAATYVAQQYVQCFLSMETVVMQKGTTFRSTSTAYLNLHETRKGELDVHVSVHSDKFLKIKPAKCTIFSNVFLELNSTCFGQFLCPLSGVFHCTRSSCI